MKILVVGNFGYVTNQLDGQTVKTRSVYELFKDSFQQDVSFFDTQSLKKNRFGLLKLVVMIIKANVLIVLPAQNSLKFIFPIVVFLKQLFRFKVYYFVVGGWLVKYLRKNKNILFLLKNIDGVFTETELMKNELSDEFSIKKVYVFPNFRNIKSEILEVPDNRENKLKLVFYSRINKLKGIDIIIDFMKNTSLDITLDFYGPIFQDDKSYFENRIKDNSNIKYKGVLNSETAYLTLCKYDMLILPTQYYNEGLPGAIVDAYFAGIPVLVTKWLHAEEFVLHNETGIIIPFNPELNELSKEINGIYENSIKLAYMKNRAKIESERFTSKMAKQVLLKQMPFLTER